MSFHFTTEQKEIMVSAMNVASYFLKREKDNSDGEDRGLSNLKLQKLIYYSQGFHLAIFGERLFPEKIEAWTHGPVCPEIYHRFKQFGSSPVVFDEDFEPEKEFNEEQVELLEEVFDVFGQFSAWKLRNMTHEEPPWIQFEQNAEEISTEIMREYFKTRLK